MTKASLQTFIRFLFRNPFYSILKLLGLSIGLAVIIMVGMYVIHETSYDRFHSDYQRIYRVVQVSNFNGIVENSSSAPFPLKNHLEREFHGKIDGCFRIFNYQNASQLVSSSDKTAFESGLFYVDPDFFQIFGIEILQQKKSNCLKDPFTAIITQSAAEKYFPGTNPIGKKLTINGRYDVLIEALAKDPPSQTHFKFQLLVSMETVRENYGGRFPDTWAWNPCWTYVKLKENVSRKEFESELLAFSYRLFPAKRDYSSYFTLQPIADIHLFSRLDYEIAPNGSWSNVITLAALGLFIFILSVINYIGLSSAKSFERSKEIAVRKVTGATDWQIVIQYIREVAFFAFLAVLISLSLVEIFMPYFRALAGVSFTYGSITSLSSLVLIIAVLVIVTILVGIYPAFLLLKIDMLEIIKGKLPAEKTQSRIRKSLVMIQVALAIGLLVVNQVVKRQYNLLTTHNLGFRSKDILIIPTRLPEVRENYDRLIAKIRSLPKVTHITGMDYKIGINHNFYLFNTDSDRKNDWQYFPALLVQDNFVETFDIEIIAGRSYNSAFPGEGNRSILISETMCNHLGITPQEALGHPFISWRGEERVVGVFRNFSAKSLHFRQEPFVLDMKTSEYDKVLTSHYTAIRVKEGAMSEVIPTIETIWKEIFPAKPFQYSLLEDEIQNHYRIEKMLLLVASVLTIIAVLMAMVGLWGLGVYYSSRRKKEFAVRLIHGAMFGDILKLLFRDYLPSLVLATLAALIISCIVSATWLSVFAVLGTTLVVSFFYTFAMAAVVFSAVIILYAYRISQLQPAIILKSD